MVISRLLKSLCSEEDIAGSEPWGDVAGSEPWGGCGGGGRLWAGMWPALSPEGGRSWPWAPGVWCGQLWAPKGHVAGSEPAMLPFQGALLL